MAQRHDIENGRMDFEVLNANEVEVGFMVYRGDDEGFEDREICLSRESLVAMLAALDAQEG